MRVGPIKYNETEERIIAKSWILGLLGLPLGFLVGIYFGFLRKEAPHDPLGLLMANAPLFATVLGFWWLTTASFSLVFWEKTDASFWRSVGKRLFPTAVIPLLMWIYVVPIMVLIFDPLDRFLLQYYSPYGAFWIGALVFFPFLLLFVYAVLPDLRPRMRNQLRLSFTRRFWREVWKNPKSRRQIKIFIILLTVLVILHLWDALT